MMTRTITAAVLLSLTLLVLPAAAADAADDATAIVAARNVRTLRQAGWSWRCIAHDLPTTTKGRVITVGLIYVGSLVVGVCTPAPSVPPTLNSEALVPTEPGSAANRTLRQPRNRSVGLTTGDYTSMALVSTN